MLFRSFTVASDSPAEKAGVMNGDLLLSFDGIEVTGVDHLHRLLNADNIGRIVPLVVLRHGKVVTLDASLTARAKT